MANKEVIKQIYDYMLPKCCGNYIGVMAIIGNMIAESDCKSENVQNSYEPKLGMTDAEYTYAVDEGRYHLFDSDKVGYGIMQWTSPSRKKQLRVICANRGVSIGSLIAQVDFMLWEMETNYPKTWDAVINAHSLETSVGVVMRDYLRPADQSNKALTRRVSLANQAAVLLSTQEEAQECQDLDYYLSSIGETLPVLYRGCYAKSDCLVKTIQSLLLVGIDGIYGPETEKAVCDYQTNKQLEVDGKVGPKTWRALLYDIIDLKED